MLNSPSEVSSLSVVSDLPGFQCSFPAETPLARIVDELERIPELPGVIVLCPGMLPAVISRSAMLEQLSRPFGQEVFLRRSLRVLLDTVRTETLHVAGDCAIGDAAHRALSRPTEVVFEPLVVELQDGTLKLLDVHTLLLAQSQLLAEANRIISEQRDAAQAASVAKSQFLANMSHEIRTPLTAILGFAENLLAPGLPEEAVQQSAGIVLRNGDHLLQVINDILDLSRIEAGRLDIEELDVELLPLVADVLSVMRVRAEQKSLPLELTFASGVPAIITSDPTRLRQILINLLGNAIKFTDRGQVTLTLGWSPDAAAAAGKAEAGELSEVSSTSAGVSAPVQADVGNGSLWFEIQDSGIGMTDSQIDRLFQPFTQADGTMKGRFGGTGLGLSISRRLCRLLGGEITVTSVAGKGSTFRFTINPGEKARQQVIEQPQDEYQQLTAASRTPEPVSASLAGMRILLADDGPDNQLLISTVLQQWNAAVETCADGVEACDLAWEAQQQGRPFHLILMDMQMPRLSGYEATRQLRDCGYSLPIVALTANAMQSDLEECLAAGCNDYSTKPIDRRQLAELLQKYAPACAECDGTADQPRLPEQPAAGPSGQPVPYLETAGAGVESSTPECEARLWDPRVGLERTGGDSELLQELIELFLQHATEWRPELQQAVEQDDCEIAQRLAHTLKGSADNIGASQLHAVCYDLETCAQAGEAAGMKALWARVDQELENLLRELHRTVTGPRKAATYGSGH